MARRTAASAILAVLLMPPLAAGAGESHEDWDTMDCGNLTFGCRLWQWTRATVESCDENNCTITINASAVGGANLPGTHSLLVTHAGEGASICIAGGRLPGLPCGSICESHSVGWQTSCHGIAKVNLSLPQGTRESLWVSALYVYDFQAAGSAGTSVHFDFLRLDDGTVEVDSYPR